MPQNPTSINMIYDIIIAGAGIVGLTTAFEAALKGKKILVLNGKIGKPNVNLVHFESSYASMHANAQFMASVNTSFAAAGMLAPINELEYGEENLLFAGMESVPLYLQYEEILGDIELNCTGSIEIVLSKQDLPYLSRAFEYRKRMGLPVEWLNSDALHNKEPFLHANIPAGIYCPSDWQLNNRLLIRKLRKFLHDQNIPILDGHPLMEWKEKSAHILAKTSEAEYLTKNLVIAIGYTEMEPFPLPYQVYPVKGQMLSLKPDNQLLTLSHTIRYNSRMLGNGYIAPKKEQIILGATNEEQGADLEITMGGIMDTMRKAFAAVPALYELPILAMWAGLRPSTIQRNPFVLKAQQKNVFYMNGFYRNGITLAPLFAKAIYQFLEDQTLPHAVQPFFYTL